MAPQYLRGGVPRHYNRATANNVLEEWDLQRVGGVANYLRFSVTGANDIILSLDKSSAEASPSEGTTVAAGATIELPAEIARFWTRSAGGASAFQAIAFIRRG